MKYPLYVHRVSNTVLRARFPDFPQVDLIGSSRAEIERNASRVIEQAYDGSDQLIPAPTGDEKLRAFEAEGDDGLWVFVDIDLARVASAAVELQFSVAATLLHRVDTAAGEQKMTRAAFLSRAATRELEASRAGPDTQMPLSRTRRFTLHAGSKV